MLLSAFVTAAILALAFFWPHAEAPDNSQSVAIDSPVTFPTSSPDSSLELTNLPNIPTTPTATATPNPRAADDIPFRLPTNPIELVVQTEQANLLREVEKASKELSLSPRIWHVAGLVYAELLQSENANRCFKKSLELDPKNVEVKLAYADSLEGLGEAEQAVAMIGEVSIENAQLVRKRGELLLGLGETDEGFGLVQKSLEMAPDDPRTNLGLAQAALQVDQPQLAEKHARRAMELGYLERPVYVALATALSRTGQREEAEKVRTEMPPLKNSSVTDSQYSTSFRGFASHSYSQIAQIFLEMDFAIEGERLAMRSLELEPESIRTLTLLGDSFRKRSRNPQAIAVYQRLTELQQDNPVVLHNLSVLLASNGDLQGAERALRSAAKIDASGAEACFLARFLLSVGKLDEARTIAQTTAENRNLLDAYLVWHEASRMLGDLHSTQRLLTMLKYIAPNDPRVRELTKATGIPN